MFISSKTVVKEEEMSNLKLLSAKGIDYTKLNDLLSDGYSWQEAEYETLSVMLKASESEEDFVGNMEDFPYEDLQIIDQLWTKHSYSRFGFSVQKQIWLEIGGSLDSYELAHDSHTRFITEKFWQVVHWSLSELDVLNSDQLAFSPAAVRGHLPAVWVNSDSIAGGFDQIYKAWVRLYRGIG